MSAHRQVYFNVTWNKFTIELLILTSTEVNDFHGSRYVTIEKKLTLFNWLQRAKIFPTKGRASSSISVFPPHRDILFYLNHQLHWSLIWITSALLTVSILRLKSETIYKKAELRSRPLSFQHRDVLFHQLHRPLLWITSTLLALLIFHLKSKTNYQKQTLILDVRFSSTSPHSQLSQKIHFIKHPSSSAIVFPSLHLR